jgi:putative MFS transporter
MSLAQGAGIAVRLDRMPATRHIWRLVTLLSLGGAFEFYDLFFTAYVVPGLVRSGLLANVKLGIFAGPATFVAATFAGLFIGTISFAFVADRFGWRSIFTTSLLWYSVCTAIMAFQTTGMGVNLWRLIAGIGIGVELVTIDTCIAELVPKHMRGRAFAFNQTVQFAVVPIVALLSWKLVPIAPLGVRRLALGGADRLGRGAGGLVPAHRPARKPALAAAARQAGWGGAHHHADRDAGRADLGRDLPPPVPRPAQEAEGTGRFAEIWVPPYRRRTIMLMVFQFF